MPLGENKIEREMSLCQLISFLRRLRRSTLGILPIFGFLACSKTEVITGDETSSLREGLLAFRSSGKTIKTFEQVNDEVQFEFSDGSMIKIECLDIPVLTIDIQGYWCLNGVLTDIQYALGSEDPFLISKSGLCGIVEGYSNWTFVFDGNERITLEKTLFSSDPDIVVRGINHRGFSYEAPENTLPAFRLSKLKGFHYVETDIRFSSDSIPVLIHDVTINRTSDGSGTVDKMSFDELRNFDFGGWKDARYNGTKIPSLQEFLELCRDIDLYPYLELKVGSKEEIQLVVSMVEEIGLKGKVIYISFSTQLLDYVIEKDPRAIIGLLASTPLKESDIQTAQRLKNKAGFVFIDSSDYSCSAVSLCKNASIPLEIWTINSKSVIESMHPYISGVTSDRFHAGRVRTDI